MSTALILTPLGAIAVVAVTGLCYRRRADRAWAAGLGRRVREGDRQAAEVAYLYALYALESTEEPTP